MTPLPVAPGLALREPEAQPRTPPRSQRCSAPGCTATAAHRHHAVARSVQLRLFGRVHDWLLINDELVLVLVDLCWRCHDRVESSVGGCKSRLRWSGGWLWYDRGEEEDTTVTRIWWFDDKTATAWKLRGFCKGEHRASTTA